MLEIHLPFRLISYWKRLTVDTTRAIEEKHLDAPHRDELEPPHWQSVVTGSSATTTATNRPAISTGMDFDLYGRVPAISMPVDCSIHKRFEFLDTIKDSLQLHPVSSSLVDALFALTSSQRMKRDALQIIECPSECRWARFLAPHGDPVPSGSEVSRRSPEVRGKLLDSSKPYGTIPSMWGENQDLALFYPQILLKSLFLFVQ